MKRRWKINHRSSLLSRLLDRMEKDPDTGCWNWQSSTNKGGYGIFNFKKRGTTAHRLLWETLFGEIDDDLDLDHLCRNRRCCNPQHLEPVTRHENIMRGDGPKCTRERRAAITHCPRGHPYEADNLIIDRRGRRSCRACQPIYRLNSIEKHRLRNREYMRAKRARTKGEIANA